MLHLFRVQHLTVLDFSNNCVGENFLTLMAGIIKRGKVPALTKILLSGNRLGFGGRHSGISNLWTELRDPNVVPCLNALDISGRRYGNHEPILIPPDVALLRPKLVLYSV